MHIDAAKEAWLQLEGKPFEFQDCVRVLHQLPKFDPMVEDEEPAEENMDGEPRSKSHNQIGKIQGDNMERPIGNKKAKRQKTPEKIEAASVQSTQVAVASSRMAMAAERRQKHDSWCKRADMCLRMGRVQEAEEMLNGMEKDEQEATGEAAARKAKEVPTGVSVPAAAASEADTAEAAENTGPFKSVVDDSFDEGDDGSSSHPSQPSDETRLKKNDG